MTGASRIRSGPAGNHLKKKPRDRGAFSEQPLQTPIGFAFSGSIL